jgi:soluble lytic murein transglycosylase-like protein
MVYAFGTGFAFSRSYNGVVIAMLNRAALCLTVACLLVSAATPARAATDPLIEGAKQCTHYFPIKEREYNIPVHLLAAISSTESGRWHKGLDMALPWPWTINAAGKGYYLNSKAEAIALAQSLMNRGVKSMDVGCMQVNLLHHAGAFRSLEEAFDPARNVDYAARFLKNNFNDLDGSWVKAAAAYHSRTPSRGNPYLQRVARAWQRIVTKVQQAQSRSGTAIAADTRYRVANPSATGSSGQALATAFTQPSYITPQQTARPAREMRRIAGTQGVKVISISPTGDVRYNPTVSGNASVLVAAPSAYAPKNGVTPAAVKLANAEPSAGGNVLRAPIQVDNAPSPAHIDPKRATFVFAN